MTEAGKARIGRADHGGKDGEGRRGLSGGYEERRVGKNGAYEPACQDGWEMCLWLPRDHLHLPSAR